MSRDPHYPVQPQGLDYHAGPGRDPMVYARRASILLFILGGLIALLGIGNLTLALSFSATELFQLNQQASMGATSPNNVISPQGFKILMLVAASIELAIGLSLMLLGTPVRRGRRWAIICAIVVVAIVGGFALLIGLLSIVASFVAPAMVGMLCVATVPITLSVYLMIWLIRAIRGHRSYPLGARQALPAVQSTAPAASEFPQFEYATQGPWVPGKPVPPPGYGAPDAGPIRYGYAQAPLIPEPPPGDTPITPPTLGTAPEQPPPDPQPPQGLGG